MFCNLHNYVPMSKNTFIIFYSNCTICSLSMFALKHSGAIALIYPTK